MKLKTKLRKEIETLAIVTIAAALGQLLTTENKWYSEIQSIMQYIILMVLFVILFIPFKITSFLNV